MEIVILIIIFSLIILFLIHRLSIVSKYSVFLENEYYHFINLLKKSSQSEREKLLDKATKTSLYRKIKEDNSTDLDRFRDMYEE